MRDILLKAIESENLPLVEKLLHEGAEINTQDNYGESVLCCAVSVLQESAQRYSIIKFLLDNGANPRILSDERGGCLQQAMLQLDTKMLEMLLDYGADPNAEAGFMDTETLYDWAEFDYRYQIFGSRWLEESNENDSVDETNWLNFLQRTAKKYNVREPDHLFLLRERGAKSSFEIEQPLDKSSKDVN